mmetsp:Transcript_3170/g.6736  ORF Transcript_3170/g.6736 Transcript_3170/m.6736 type:complete len:128 (+) Transcript_3170:113-496(+)
MEVDPPWRQRLNKRSGHDGGYCPMRGAYSQSERPEISESPASSSSSSSPRPPLVFLPVFEFPPTSALSAPPVRLAVFLAGNGGNGGVSGADDGGTTAAAEASTTLALLGSLLLLVVVVVVVVVVTFG